MSPRSILPLVKLASRYAFVSAGMVRKTVTLGEGRSSASEPEAARAAGTVSFTPPPSPPPPAPPAPPWPTSHTAARVAAAPALRRGWAGTGAAGAGRGGGGGDAGREM